MAMVIQNNLNAINANNKLGTNVLGTKKSTEKLSSGFRINRAADDAAGLAISEKMRAQLRGLGQAIRNANDGISLIQTAEGALDETHAMLKRLKELAVQAGNDTYSDEERDYMQMEIEDIKSEIDRIAKATDFNGIKMLDGSLSKAGGNVNSLGARYGILDTAAGALYGSSVTSSIAGVTVTFAVANASGASTVSAPGGEFATWNEAGTTLTISLAQNTSYTQAQIDALIANADRSKAAQTASIPDVSVKLGSGVVSTTTVNFNFNPTVAGVQSQSDWTSVTNLYSAGAGGVEQEKNANFIRFTSNSYGVDDRQFVIVTSTVKPGDERVQAAGSATGATVAENSLTKNGIYEIHLSTGYTYTAQDIMDIMAKAGLDYTVELSATNTGTERAPSGDVTFRATVAASAASANAVTATMAGGQGLGNDHTNSGGKGLTFQIGANNATEQRVVLNIENMSSSALGISNFNVSSVENARQAMSMVESAITSVSRQRAGLGAMQNRLEHTVNSLTVTHENLTAAESQIRDTDMAKEMVEYTKYNILQQAAQAMLAQANQAPQAILQLLR